MAAVRALVAAKAAAGDLVLVDVPNGAAEPDGLLGMAGKYKDDPTWLAIRDEAYRLRDEEKAREFPE